MIVAVDSLYKMFTVIPLKRFGLKIAASVWTCRRVVTWTFLGRRNQVL